MALCHGYHACKALCTANVIGIKENNGALSKHFILLFVILVTLYYWLFVKDYVYRLKL